MKGIFISFLFCCSSVFAQKIYQPHEVERPASPSGGEELFHHFVKSNLRFPIKSTSGSKNARVFVNAVVETDGTVSNLSVLKGLDSLSNQEAIRVVQLYNAWKPATSKGAVVRQSVTLPIAFKADPISGYDSVSQNLIAYFDKNWVTSSVKEKQKFRRHIPVDAFGFVNGDISYEKIEEGKWSSLGSIPFTKKEFWRKSNKNGKKDSTLVFLVSANYEVGSQPIYQSVEKDPKGQMLEYREFAEDNKVVLEKSFYANGMLKEMTEHGKDIRRRTYWYDNGQLTGIFEGPAPIEVRFAPLVKEYYDKNGNHLVKNGTGQVLDHSKDFTGLDGRGEFKNGVKEGIWTSKSEDSSFVYEEHYNKGILTKGTSYRNGEKYEYTQFEVQPEFAGGLPSMYNYLATNIKYPRDAAKRNIQGRVFTTFVVCEDGTLCDFEILQGLDKNIDKEALRVIEGMSGKWKPGWQRGQKVRVKYNLPINFQLN